MKRSTTGQLKEIGLKVTPQRQAVLAFLNGNKNHPSAEDIYHELLKQFPGISFATVYNTLSRLAKAARIQELNIDPQRTRFDPCLDLHHHFYCKVCARVFDLPCAMSNSIDTDFLGITNKDGHHIDTVQVNVKGTCKHCGTRQNPQKHNNSNIAANRRLVGKQHPHALKQIKTKKSNIKASDIKQKERTS